MKLSQTFEPELHKAGSTAAQGQCFHHAPDGGGAGPYAGEAVVSFPGPARAMAVGCSLALEQLVEEGEIEPLGPGG